MYAEWAERTGYPPANHYIVTKYVDEKQSIGMHFDKPKSIQQGSLITIVKTGLCGRPFKVRDRVFFTKRQSANIMRQQARNKVLRKRVKAWKGEKEAATRTGANLKLCVSIKLASGSIKRCDRCIDAVRAEQKKAQDAKKPFVDKVLDTGTAVIMTLEANLVTQHGVPEVDHAGPSGSLVFRTITEKVPTYPKA